MRWIATPSCAHIHKPPVLEFGFESALAAMFYHKKIFPVAALFETGEVHIVEHHVHAVVYGILPDHSLPARVGQAVDYLPVTLHRFQLVTVGHTAHLIDHTPLLKLININFIIP